MRQYARERLLQSGEAERLRDRHLAFFHELVQRAEPELTRAGQVAWLNRLQREHDNLRLALEWCLAAPERGEQSVELAAALCWFWMKRGYFREGQECLERALAASGNTPAALRAKALMSLGSMTFFQGDLARTRALLRRKCERSGGPQEICPWSGSRLACSRSLRWSSATSQRAPVSPPKGRPRRVRVQALDAGAVSRLSRVPRHARG